LEWHNSYLEDVRIYLDYYRELERQLNAGEIHGESTKPAKSIFTSNESDRIPVMKMSNPFAGLSDPQNMAFPTNFLFETKVETGEGN